MATYNLPRGWTIWEGIQKNSIWVKRDKDKPFEITYGDLIDQPSPSSPPLTSYTPAQIQEEFLKLATQKINDQMNEKLANIAKKLNESKKTAEKSPEQDNFERVPWTRQT